MKALRKFVQDYRKMTSYRDGEYRKNYNRDCLQKFVIFSFLMAAVLGLDLLSYVVVGNSGAGTSLETLQKVVYCLLGSGVISLAVLHKKLSPALKELGRGLALLIMLAFYLQAICFELRYSGGLYIYVIAILIFGGIVHLRMRENLLVILVVDLTVLYAHLIDNISFAERQIYLSPLRMIAFCSVAAAILALWRNYEYLSLIWQRARLQELNGIDSLTKLLNRRGMEFSLGRSSSNGQVCVAIFDIDDFKKYNDTYGHGAGDECLLLVAGLLKETAKRHHGLAVRYGGEEMVLIFFSGDLDRVRKILNGTLTKLRELHRPSGRGAEHEFLTLSCGVTVSRRAPGHDVDAYYRLIAEADKKLYLAKRCGKDRVVG